MGKVIELPEVLNVSVPERLIEEVRRYCGRQPKRIERFIIEAIEDKLAYPKHKEES
jgi:hypothetical protein